MRYKRHSNIGLENDDFAFFAESGEDRIKVCFHQVLWRNIKPPDPTKKKQKYKPSGKNPRGPRPELPPIDPEFKAIVEGLDDYHRIDWPNNNHFSNGLKHLHNQYSDNVVTNLTTHANKHITQYLKLKVFQWNSDAEEGEEIFLPSDIASVVDLIVKQKVIKVPIRDPNKLERCSVLYDMVNDLNVFPDIDLHDLTTDKQHWFKAMPMYLSMQREIEDYNSEWTHQHRPKRKKRKRKKTKGKWKRKRKQMLDNPNFRPFIRNLVVVPMCSFRRTHLRIDCSSMHLVLSSQKLLPKVETVNRKGDTSMLTLPEKDFNHSRDYWWNQYFYMRKIRRFVRGKKKFNYSINTDGISVSLQYSAKKKTNNEEIDQDSRIVEGLTDGTFKNLVGVDTGVRSWNTSVTHNISTGKEVSFLYICTSFIYFNGNYTV